jgi:hypothetical protein
MDIQIDSREKARAIKKILAEFDKNDVVYEVSKLPVGDYMNLDNPRLIIDRKQNLSEIYTNLCHQRKRFEAELERARKMHRQLIILCEHGNGVKSIEDVKDWQNPQLEKTPYAWEGVKLYMEMRKLSAKFGVAFEFCSKADTGKRIIELLR